MKSLIRSSTNPDLKTALKESCEGINDPKGIIVLSAPETLEEVSNFLFEKFPCAKTIGGSGSYVYNAKLNKSGFTLIFLLDDVEVVCGLIRNISSTPADALMDIAKNASEIRPGDNNTVCIEFTTGNEEILLSIFRSAFNLNNIYKPDSIKLAGGSIFGSVENDYEDTVSYNGKIYRDSCAYIMIKNKTGKIRTYHEHTYRKKNDQSFIVTKANFKTREIKEIDGRPAAEVYKENMGEYASLSAKDVSHYPIGRLINGEIYPVVQTGITKENTILNHTLINEGDRICFLEADPDYPNKIKNTVKEILRDTPNPSLIFVFDCAYRLVLFETDGFINTYLGLFNKNACTTGYICGGEQFGNKHMNITAICVVFE